MKSNLVDYLMSPDDLATMINAARNKSRAGNPASYLAAARELALKLFTGEGGSDADAKSAEKAFKELVKESPTRPVIVARVSSERVNSTGQHKTFFLPLGILSARGTDAEPPYLSQPITVVQPLPRERYRSRKSCIAEWTFGIPTELDKVGSLVGMVTEKAKGKWLDNLEALKTYFADIHKPDDSPGQGFLLLAHHNRGKLWFESEENRVNREDIRRSFPPNSVGILAACSAASASYDNSLLVRDFNQLGLDAIVASPFPIPARYGTRLAVQFTRAVQELRQDGVKEITVADLFSHAIKRTAEQLKRDFTGEYEEIGLEYILLGNPTITICDSAAALQ
jgi:hypothetical protein